MLLMYSRQRCQKFHLMSLELRRYFPKEEGMMQRSDVGISLSDETKVIELVGEPSNTT